ncbi:MAG: YHS domain-containing protein [Nitrososphaerales archaeon]
MLLKDPVCDSLVDPRKVENKIDESGTMYYFCSRDCKEIFQRERTRFVKKSSKE